MRDKSLKHKSVTPTSVSVRKKTSRRKKKKQTSNDSITKVYFSEPSDSPYYSNNRGVHSLRCDDGLWKALKPALKRDYGSICQGIEVYAVAVLHKTSEKVNICNTINPLTLNQTVTRSLKRERRKLVVDEEAIVDDEVLNTPVTGSPETCAVCGAPSYARGTNKDETQVWLCRKHFRERKRSFIGWLPVKDYRRDGLK